MKNDGKYSYSLSSLADELRLEAVYLPEGFEEREVHNSAINRPGMQLIGFFSHFDSSRIQLMGIVEVMYLKTLPQEERKKIFAELFKRGIPALIISNGMPTFPDCVEMAAKYATPLFKTARDTSEFAAEVISRLCSYLAPRQTMHGVMVQVYGEGLLLVGDSGVGKSETAIELVKRGHMLIADDAVEIKRISYNTLVASAPELIRHYIELRGIGVIDVRREFGIGSVTESGKVDLVISLELWDNDANYDRLGADTAYTTLLDVSVPQMRIPVKPGRNLAVIVEAAAMNNKLKKSGYNAAAELIERLGVRENGSRRVSTQIDDDRITVTATATSLL